MTGSGKKSGRIPMWAIFLAVVSIFLTVATWWWVGPGKLANVVVLHDSQNAQALNVVILGDGFTAASDSMGAYHAAAEQFTNRLKEVTPFRAMTDAFNVYRVDVISPQSGIDVPVSCGSFNYASPPDPSLRPWARVAADRNTVLGTTFCPSQWPKSHGIGSNNWNQIWNYANASGVFPHVVIVLVNDWMYGATAFSNAGLWNGSGGVAFVTIGKNLTQETNPLTGNVLQPNWNAVEFPDLAVHETGHLGPFRLRDEYGSRPLPIDPADLSVIDASPNLTSSDVPPVKWETLRTPGSTLQTVCPDPPSPNPTLPDAAVAPGGERYAAGVFHARCECRMNGYSSDTFCVVCRRQILDVLAGKSASTVGSGTLRLILDSVRLKTLPNGKYFIDFQVTLNGSSVLGRWPEAPMTAALSPTKTAEPGFTIGDIALPSGFAGSTVAVAYTIFGQDNTGGQIPIGAHTATVTVPAAGRGDIEQFDWPTHRVTIGITRR